MRARWTVECSPFGEMAAAAARQGDGARGGGARRLPGRGPHRVRGARAATRSAASRSQRGSSGSAIRWPTATTSCSRCRSSTTGSVASPTSSCAPSTPTPARSPTSRSTPSSPATRRSPATCCSCASTPRRSPRSPARGPSTCASRSGPAQVETIRVDDVLPYWRRLRGQLAGAGRRAAGRRHVPRAVRPLPVLRVRDGVRGPVARSRLARARRRCPRGRSGHAARRAGVSTIARLAALDRDRDRRPRRRSPRAVRPPGHAAGRSPASTPTTRRRSSCLTDADRSRSNAASETEAVGFAAMPAPDDGDVFLDFEGHPFWRADVGLFFLFGWIERSATPATGSSRRCGRTTRRRRPRPPSSSSTTSTPAASGSRTCTCTTTTTPSGRRCSG